MKKLEDKYVQLSNQINFLKNKLNINDDSDDSDYKFDIPKLEDIKDDVKKRTEYNKNDDYNSSDEQDGPN